MDVLMTVAAEDVADALRDLRSWLVEEPDLRGRVQIRERDAAAGRLGPVPEALQVVLQAGGAAAVASVVVAWLGSRRGEVSVKLTRGDGESLEVAAKGVKGLDLAKTRTLTAQVAELLGSPDLAQRPGEDDDGH
jgi:Effector Associated Constant Component 1